VGAPSFSLVLFERKDGNSHQRPGISSPGLFFRREFIRGGPHVARRLRFMWGSPGCCLSIRRDSGRRVPKGRRRHRRTPAAYKSIAAVMEAQKDLVDIVHTLRQVVCVKG
jgi:hypothetical protein